MTIADVAGLVVSVLLVAYLWWSWSLRRGSGLEKLNITRLHSPTSAITSAITFNALIIVALIPLALRGVRYTPSSASALLRRNLWIYGIGVWRCRSSGSNSSN